MQKGTVGYINKRKRIQILYTLVIILISLALFFIGWKVTHTTKNLMTVVAVLGVLPGAKSLVAVIVLLPYKSLTATKAESFSQACPEGAEKYADLVFSSPEHVMHIDYLCVNGTECVGYAADAKKTDRIEKYFTETMRKQGVSIHMKVFTKDTDFVKRLESLKPSEEVIPKELQEWIEAILV